MPKQSSILYTVFSIKEKNTKYEIRNTRYKKSAGFGLIEIILSVVLIIAIATGLFATAGTFLIRRKSDLQAIAAKIASKDIEYLRNLSFASLPGTTTPGPNGCPQPPITSDPDLVKLPDGKCSRTITNYTGDTNIKQITITIRWQENNISKNLVMDTLIYANGL